MNSAKMTTGMPEMPTMPKTNFVGSETAVTKPMMGGKKKVAKKSPAKKTTKKGGALMDDVKNLAVPFAILLAKQGLQTMFDRKKTAKKGGEVELSASSASKVNSLRRRSTIAGGSCGSQCAGVSQFTQQNVQSPTMSQSVQLGGKKKKVLRKKVAKKGGADDDDDDDQNNNIFEAEGGKKKKSVKKTSKKAGGSQSQQVKSRFEKLSKEIDEFLQKY